MSKFNPFLTDDDPPPKGGDTNGWKMSGRSQNSTGFKIIIGSSKGGGGRGKKNCKYGNAVVKNKVSYSRGKKAQSGFMSRLAAHLNYIVREENYENKAGEGQEYMLVHLDHGDLTPEEAIELISERNVYCKHQMIISPEGMDKLTDGQVDDLMYNLRDYIKENNKYGADCDFFYSLHRDTDAHHCHVVLTSENFLLLQKHDMENMRELCSEFINEKKKENEQGGPSPEKNNPFLKEENEQQIQKNQIKDKDQEMELLE